jgi:transaldolase
LTHPSLNLPISIRGGARETMSNSSIAALIHSGTKLYLDSIDPDLVDQNIRWGAVGATSNPIIVSNLVRTGRFDDRISRLLESGLGDEAICWELTDELVSQAQVKFEQIWTQSKGNAGWVSFELDPLVEDPARNLPHRDRVERYIDLGRRWSRGHRNRMIKVPATPAGLDALEQLAADGVTLNVTLIFTQRQYLAARDSVWRGAQRRANLEGFKSVYSIFVSRIDQYTAEYCPSLSPEAQGIYGILNAKRIWSENARFWSSHPTPLQQEIIFASTGTKNANDPPWKYVAALAGSDIQTNPPETNTAVAANDLHFTRQVDAMPSEAICRELDQTVGVAHMEETLMEQGIAKFVAPQQQLLATIAAKRAVLMAGT